jgi:hypothetical protein
MCQEEAKKLQFNVVYLDGISLPLNRLDVGIGGFQLFSDLLQSLAQVKSFLLELRGIDAWNRWSSFQFVQVLFQLVGLSLEIDFRLLKALDLLLKSTGVLLLRLKLSLERLVQLLHFAILGSDFFTFQHFGLKAMQLLFDEDLELRIGRWFALYIFGKGVKAGIQTVRLISMSKHA